MIEPHYYPFKGGVISLVESNPDIFVTVCSCGAFTQQFTGIMLALPPLFKHIDSHGGHIEHLCEICQTAIPSRLLGDFPRWHPDCAPSCMWCAKTFQEVAALEAHEEECVG